MCASEAGAVRSSDNELLLAEASEAGSPSRTPCVGSRRHRRRDGGRPAIRRSLSLRMLGAAGCQRPRTPPRRKQGWSLANSKSPRRQTAWVAVVCRVSCVVATTGSVRQLWQSRQLLAHRVGNSAARSAFPSSPQIRPIDPRVPRRDSSLGTHGKGRGYVTRRYEPGSRSPPCLSVSDRPRLLPPDARARDVALEALSCPPAPSHTPHATEPSSCEPLPRQARPRPSSHRSRAHTQRQNNKSSKHINSLWRSTSCSYSEKQSAAAVHTTRRLISSSSSQHEAPREQTATSHLRPRLQTQTASDVLLSVFIFPTAVASSSPLHRAPSYSGTIELRVREPQDPTAAPGTPSTPPAPPPRQRPPQSYRRPC